METHAMTSDRIFKIIGNKIRLRLLALLAESPLRVGELAEITGMPMATISKDLMRLRAKKIVSAKRLGVFITYSLAETPTAETLRAVLAAAQKSFPPEVLADAERRKNFVPAKTQNSAENAEVFNGNKIPARERAKIRADESADERNAHIGELPTNLL